MDNRYEVKYPVDEEWELYKKCGWKTFGDDRSTCLDWWRAASVRMPHLSRLVRWSWSCKTSSCSLERLFSKVGFINNHLCKGQTPRTLWEATLLSSIVTDAAPERNLGASSSLHAESSTPVGPDT